MSRVRAVVLTYHAIESGTDPLCVEPSLFAEHLGVIRESSLRVIALDQLAEELGAGGPERDSISISFDDGYSSVVEHAVPMLAAQRLPATIFCVAGHLGGVNGWPSEPASAPRRRLAGAAELAEVAGPEIELGSHGISHVPLELADGAAIEREIVASRELLEDATGAPVRLFAFPYGSLPGPGGVRLAERHYAGAAAGGNRAARPGDGRWAIPRIDAHYLRRPARLRRVLSGRHGYLEARRRAARVRRLVRRDYSWGHRP